MSWKNKMRLFLTTIATSALLFGCDEAPSTPQTEKAAEVEVKAETSDGQYEKFAAVPMNPDVSFLTESERKTVNILIEASDYLSQIYLRQRGADYPERRAALEKTGGD